MKNYSIPAAVGPGTAQEQGQGISQRPGLYRKL